jgi:hypothetical protein
VGWAVPARGQHSKARAGGTGARSETDPFAPFWCNWRMDGARKILKQTTMLAGRIVQLIGASFLERLTQEDRKN